MGEPRPAPPPRRVSRLLRSNNKYDMEEPHWEQLYNSCILKHQQACGASAFQDKLLVMASQQDQRERVTQALIYGILVETPDKAPKLFEYLCTVTTDQWFNALCNVNMIIFECYHRLRDNCRDQLITFFRLAIKANVPKIDNVLLNYVRYVNDSLDWNVRVKMARQVAQLLTEQSGREWMLALKQAAPLNAFILLAFTRLSAEMSGQPALESTRLQLRSLCAFIIRRRFADAMILGRDLLLVILRCVKTPQIAPIWRDLIHNPASFAPGFRGIEELLARSCTTASQMRISITLHRKIDFMLKLKPGQHERHFEWFAEAHLKGPDSGSLRGELLRYVLHAAPEGGTHEMRPLLIHFLFNSTVSPEHCAFLRSYFWWDWLGFVPQAEHYHPIDYAFNSLRHILSFQPTLAHSLFDFIIKESAQLWPPLSAKMRSSVSGAFRLVAEAQGSPAVQSVLESSRLDSRMREMLREALNPMARRAVPATSVSSSSPSPAPSNSQSSPSSATPQEGIAVKNSSAPESAKEKEKIKGKERVGSSRTKEEEAIAGLFKQIRGELRDLLEAVKAAQAEDDSERAEALAKLATFIVTNEEVQEDDALLDLTGQALLACLPPLTASDGSPLIPDSAGSSPSHPSHGSLSHLLAAIASFQLHALFQSLQGTEPDSQARQALLTVLSAMREKEVAVSMQLLVYIRVCGQDSQEVSPSLYEELASIAEVNLEFRLEEDMERFALDDRRVFSLLLPFVFKNFPLAAASHRLFRVISHYINAQQLNEFLGEVVREDLSLFRRETFMAVMSASLDWAVIPQIMLWQLVWADGVTAEWMYPLFNRVSTSKHEATASQLILLLKRQEPNSALVRHIFSRPTTTDDPFTVNAIKVMIEDQESCHKTADLTSTLIRKLLSSGDILLSSVAPSKESEKGRKPGPRLSLEHVLFHLSEMASRCVLKEKRMTELLLTRESFREALTAVRKGEKSALLYNRYPKLFTVVDLMREAKGSRTLRANRAAARAAAGKRTETPPPQEDDSGPRKKTRRTVINDSDSD